MKKLIHETPEVTGNNYQLYATATPHEGYVHLKFTSVWSGAKDPHGEQNKFETFLKKEDIARLRSLLEDAENELA